MSFFSAAQVEALSSKTVRLATVAELDFASGAAYVWNGITAMVSNGKTYIPMKGTGRIDGIGDIAGNESRAVTMSVALADLTDEASEKFFGAALSDPGDITQRLAIIGLQLFDDEWQPVGASVPLFWGYMQPPKINRTVAGSEEGSTQTAEIVAENAFYNRSRPAYGLFTDRDQQKRFPGDKFLSYVASILFKRVTYPDY